MGPGGPGGWTETLVISNVPFPTPVIRSSELPFIECPWCQTPDTFAQVSLASWSSECGFWFSSVGITRSLLEMQHPGPFPDLLNSNLHFKLIPT